MNTEPFKYLYCLISRIDDLYYEQAFISISSLKIHNPNAFVCLFTDKDTIDSIKSRKADISKIADEIVVQHFEESIDSLNRSRILKTTMRNKISGDFLYIDCDTIICQNLSEIENINFDLGAVLDYHKSLPNHILMYQIIERRKLLLNDPDFYNSSYYFNGGIIFARDTEFNNDFFKKWNENYLLGCKINLPMDMPSLALTNYQLGSPIKELDGKWNVQVWHGANYFQNAKIIHYYATILDHRKYEPYCTVLPLKVKKNGYLSEEDISLILNPLRFFGDATYIISGCDYLIFRSSIGGFIRNLYKHQFLFKLFEKIFDLAKKITSNG